MERLQMVITFDRELGLKRFKNESCSKWGNEAPGLRKFQNSIV